MNAVTKGIFQLFYFESAEVQRKSERLLYNFAGSTKKYLGVSENVTFGSDT